MSIEVAIYDYVNGSDKNLIQSWMDDRTTREKAKLNANLITLREVPRVDWHTHSCVKKLKGQADLWEILAFPENVQLRPIGFFGPGSSFTLLVGVIKKGGKLLPPSALSMAQKRKEDVSKDPQKYRTSHIFKQTSGVSQ